MTVSPAATRGTGRPGSSPPGNSRPGRSHPHRRRRRPIAPSRVFWWSWVGVSLVWIAIALAVFPQRWNERAFWDALLATDRQLTIIQDTGHVLDPEVARGVRQLERMARERQQIQRARELGAAFASLGLLFGPSLLILAGGFVFTMVFAERLDRHPPAPRSPEDLPHASDIVLPPTTYVPPHRRYEDD